MSHAARVLRVRASPWAAEAPDADPRVRVSLFGAGDVRGADGQPLTAVIAQPRRLALLAYLALAAAPDVFHSRARILPIFWPEHDEAHARANLRQALHFLRRTLGDDTLTSRGGDQLRVETRAFWCDAVAFEAAIERGDAESAVELYRGDLLDGLYLHAAPQFEDWLERRRDHLARRYVAALEILAARHSARRAHDRAAECWRAILARAPENGHAVLGLMRALGAAGERAAALHAAERHCALLAREFDAAPDASVVSLAARLRAEGGG